MAVTSRPRTRSPWLALLLSLVSTTLAMLYVGRGRRAFAYFLVFTGLLAAYLVAGLAGTPVLAMDVSYTVLFVGATVVGAVDAWRIGRAHQLAFAGGWYSRWPFLVGMPLALLTSLLAVRFFLTEPFRIPAKSMEPTLRRGDFLLAWKWPYRNYGTYGIAVTHGLTPRPSGLPARGDIVLFRYHGDPRIVYIKRVIGMPGDRVVFDRGVLTINGQIVARRETDESPVGTRVYEESLGNRQYSVIPGLAHSGVSVSMAVPPGHYFVLGDNREASHDSRHFGFVAQNHLIGRPLWIWWSVSEEGYVRRERLGLPVR